MKTHYKLIAMLALLGVLILTSVMPAQAFDGRTGEKVTIAADEVIEDDLYVSAAYFTLDGTVKGDVVVTGTVMIINGTIEGDLIAAGQTIVINGTVKDDARIAGAILQVGEKASIGDELVAAGASLEAKSGSQIGDDLTVGAGQALLAGVVSGDVRAGTGSLELRGKFGGDVQAEVGDPGQDEGPPAEFFSMFIPQNEVTMPSVLPGLTIAPDAQIAGDLEYTQMKDINIPANVVGGKVSRNEPVADPNMTEVQPTFAEAATTWTLDLLRSIVTLILVGLLLGWLAPRFTQNLMGKIREKTITALGWGVVAYAAFFFAILLIIVAMVIGATVFGALTLGSLTATIIWVGILALFALTVVFVLAVTFLSKVTVAWLGGKLLLSRFKPDLAENKFAPLILGALLLALLIALPYIGWIFSMLTVLAGLGALWLWGGELRQAGKTSAEAIAL